MLTLRVVQLFIVCGATAITFGVIMWMYPPLLVWGLAVSDRKSMCTVEAIQLGAEMRWDFDKALSAEQGDLRLIESDPDGFEHWAASSGEFWLPEGSIGVLPTLLAQQLVDIYSVRSLIGPGDVVIDCDARFGTYARQALRAGAAKVIAIESDPARAECIRRNLKEEVESKRVVIYSYPIDPPSEEFFELESRDIAAERAVRSPIHIDTLVRKLNLKRVDVIKFDVKGAALPLLEGAEETLATYRPGLVVSTEHAADDGVIITEWISALGQDYQTECGICSLGSDWKVKPDMITFQTLSP